MDKLTPPNQERPNGGSLRTRTLSAASLRGTLKTLSRNSSKANLKAAQPQPDGGSSRKSNESSRSSNGGNAAKPSPLASPADERKVSNGVANGEPDKTCIPPPATFPKPGHPGNLSVAQAAALKTLEEALQREDALPPAYASPDPEERLWGEVVLLRFLRARQFNAQNALTMYRASQTWRSSVALPTLVDRSSSTYFDFTERDAVCAAGWDMYFHKVDKFGRPIFVQALAGLDTVALLKATTPERITLNFACTLETAVQSRYRACTTARRAAGDEKALIDDNFMIVDIAALGMGTFWAFKGQLQQLLSVLDGNFPELSGRVQIINAPWLFSTIWGYMKAWLPVGTVDKIDIAGTDYAKALLAFIEPENLPVSMGGTCACEEGCHRSDKGPWRGDSRPSKEQVQASIVPPSESAESEAQPVKRKPPPSSAAEEALNNLTLANAEADPTAPATHGKPAMVVVTDTDAPLLVQPNSESETGVSVVQPAGGAKARVAVPEVRTEQVEVPVGEETTKPAAA